MERSQCSMLVYSSDMTYDLHAQLSLDETREAPPAYHTCRDRSSLMLSERCSCLPLFHSNDDKAR